MEFNQKEIIFYATVFLTGVAGGASRLWAVGWRASRGRKFGRVLSAGLVAFGTVGLWVGRDPNSVTGPFFYVALAALTGFMSEEVKSQILDRVAALIINVFPAIKERAGQDATTADGLQENPRHDLDDHPTDGPDGGGIR